MACMMLTYEIGGRWLDGSGFAVCGVVWVVKLSFQFSALEQAKVLSFLSAAARAKNNQERFLVAFKNTLLAVHRV